MDNDRFDSLTRALGAGRSRRGVLKGFGKGLGAAALGAAGLSRFGATKAANLGNSPCAHFCVTVYPPGPERGACISAAANGEGLCPSCGANADPTKMCTSDTGVIYCPDFSSDPANCGSCGATCAQPDNGSASCSGGGCVVACNAGYQPDGNGGCAIICAEPGPGSSYALTCTTNSETCTAEGTILNATCAPNGTLYRYVNTTINVNDCSAQNYVITNCNGQLTCGGC